MSVVYPVDKYLEESIGALDSICMESTSYINTLNHILDTYSGTGITNKTMVFITGQPGTGKNHIIQNKLSSIMKNNIGLSHPIEEFCIVDHDDWRKYHPQFFTLTKENVVTASQRIQEDIDALEKDVFSNIINRGKNIIFSDGAFGVYERTVNYLNQLNKNNYNVSLVLIAMNMKLSEQNVRYRYEKAIKENQTDMVRWVLHDVQIGVFNNIVDCLGKLNFKNFKNIVILDSNHNVIGDYKNPTESKKEGIIKVIESERSRPMSKNEWENYCLRWEDIYNMAMGRFASHRELAHLKSVFIKCSNESLNYQKDLSK